MKKIFFVTAAVLAALFIVCFPVSAGADTYAKGDTVTISGTATGNPQQGLAFWVFGPNYWTRETQSVTGESYTYEISKSVTENLASGGHYFCIVQHPMYNGIFDVDISSGTPASGQTYVASSAGQQFIIGGSGKLQGSTAAFALMNMLESPDIDDTYTVTEFDITDPWIRFTPEDTYYAGDMLLISGQTNVAAGERLLYELYSASFVPTSKSSSSGFSGDSGYTTVLPANPDNIWEIPVDTTGMKPDVYLFKISREDGSGAHSAEFTLAEERPVVTEVYTQTPLITEPPVSKTETPTPAAGFGGILVMSSLILAFIILALKKV